MRMCARTRPTSPRRNLDKLPLLLAPRAFSIIPRFIPLRGDKGAEIIDDGSWFSWDIISQFTSFHPLPSHSSRTTNAQCANNEIPLW